MIWAVLLAVYVGIFFAIPINLSTADLGRHITNGALLLDGVSDLLYTNFYSFTEPDHTFTNHHWGSGVLFHLTHKLAGFKGLSLLYILLSVACLLTMVRAASVKANSGWALLAATISVPLFAYRVEVRPEGFSYLLLAVYYLLLTQYGASKLSFKKLLGLIVPLQLLWVNLHIFFFLGIGVISVFLLEAVVNQGGKQKLKELGILLVATVGISLVNPHFITGFLAPLTIFNEYGYMVVENQTVFFLYERFGNPQFIHLGIFGVIALVVAIMAVIKGMWRGLFVEAVMVLGFLGLSIMAVRGIPLFALFFIPFLGKAASFWSDSLNFSARQTLQKVIPFVGIAICVILIPMKGTYASANKGYNALGLYDGLENSGRFLQRAGIPGNIFNNYDIGSYLIYYLKDSAKVFVDNRPEAYSVAFFDSIYKPMQEDDAIFAQMVEKYDLNVICFFRHDGTPWAQPFLIRRTQDPDWVPILVDDVSLILIRNLPANRPWIEQYALPREMFRSVPTS